MSTITLNAVTGDDKGLAAAVGGKYLASYAAPGGWQMWGEAGSNTLAAVWTPDGKAGYLAGENRTLLRYVYDVSKSTVTADPSFPPTNCATIPTLGTPYYRAVWANDLAPGDADFRAVAVGSGGNVRILMQIAGSTCAAFQDTDVTWMNTVHGTVNDLWIAGSGGFVWQYNAKTGTLHAVSSNPTTTTLNGVWVNPGTLKMVVVVGEAGKIFATQGYSPL
jgi:hypothetical protein